MQIKLTTNFNTAFTLIELLAVITIMVILITAAIPGWKNFVQNNQAMTIATKLSNSLRLAKATAIQSGQTVTLCPVAQSSGTTCTNTTAWDAWVSFIDTSPPNGTFTTNTGENYYYDQPTGVITASSTGYISFNSAGFFIAAGKTFTIKPTGCTGNNGRIITIMPSGNIQTTFTACP